jgi:hypothetical protein
VLEGIDDIDWSVLEHAYGPANDVPDLVRALAGPGADEREKALRTLYGNVFHQGTRYEATAYVVPFVLELLADPATPGRAELVHLLTRLAVGYDEQWLPGTFPVVEHRTEAVGGEALLRAAPPVVDEWAEDDDEDDFDDDEDEDDEDRYSYYESLSDEDAAALYAHVVLAAYDAVRAGVPLLRTLVADEDSALRREAAYALAWFPEDAAGSVPALVAASAEPGDDGAAATALVALGLLARGGDDGLVAPAAVAAAAARGGGPELVRGGAAVALAALWGAGAGPEVVAELVTWAGGGAVPRDDVPFLDGDVGSLAALALRHPGEAHAEVAFDALLRRLRSVSGPPAVTVLAEALRRAWPDGGPVPDGTPYAALTGPQQRLLAVLADSPATWRYGDFPLFGNFTGLLSSYALPRDPDRMRTYVGV